MDVFSGAVVRSPRLVRKEATTRIENILEQSHSPTTFASAFNYSRLNWVQRSKFHPKQSQSERMT